MKYFWMPRYMEILSYSEIEYLYENDLTNEINNSGVMPSIQISHNAKIKLTPNNSNDYINIEEETFIFPINTNYYHFLIDSVAFFLYLRSLFPNIKAMPIYFANQNEDLNQVIFNDNKFILEILELIGINKSDIKIISNHNANYYFSKLYSYNKKKSDKIDDELYKYPFIYNIFKNFFSNLIEKRSKEKIYISRKNIKNRSISNEQVIEKFFIDLGFKIVYLENLSFIEKIQTFYNSSVVVSRFGSSLTNAIFCNNAIVIEIRNDTENMGTFVESICKINNSKFASIYCGTTDDGNKIVDTLKPIFNLSR